MKKIEKINTFLNSKNFAISGVSKDENKFGRMVYKTFIERGKKVLPINPTIQEINGQKVYSSVSELPSEVEALIILNNRDRSQDIINQAITKGIKNIWIQQSSDPKGFSVASIDPSFNVITGECIFMWVEPVKGVHKFHRFLKFLFSKN